ncbi:acyl-CoA dehydrogenase family protein [Dactylosporangium cerinum]|uniref:Acyl-CoA dehydrogenase family protein n=1 Tax=Dactylosporangium cerinum TaxID=1434730 RepID=A0ABV9W5W1_9ACTN
MSDRAGAPLDGLTTEAGLREVWARLGKCGVLTELYHHVDGERRLRAEPLRALLAALDSRGRTGVTLAVCVQVASVLPLLDAGAAGSPVVASLLDRALAGEQLVALAVTDAGAPGSDLAALDTTLETDGDMVTVTGAKRWITNATGCDYFLTLARHRPGRHFTSFAWILVPARAAGVEVAAAPTPLFAGSGTGEVRFDRVRLSTAHLVGRPGRALASFARHITRERFAGAVWTVALLRRALTDTRASLTGRNSDGAPLWSMDLLRHRCASAVVEIRLLNALTYEVEQQILNGYDAAAAALVKTAAARTAESVLTACASLQGADGYLPGAAQQLRAEAAVFGIGGGTVDLMLSDIAEHAEALLAQVQR